MNITPISYRQACEILGSKYTTLINATERGVFTKLPVTGPEQRIVKEQVILFIGKKQLKLTALSREERQIWEELYAIASPIPVTSTPAPTTRTSAPSFALLDKNALVYMHESGLSIRADTPQGSVSFRSALTDKQASNIEENVLGIALLLGLVVLLIGYVLKSEKTKDAAQTILETVGTTYDELLTADGRQRVLIDLQEHPQKVRELQGILKQEGLAA